MSVVEQPKQHQKYQPQVISGCAGEYKWHGIAPIINKEAVTFDSIVDHTDGEHIAKVYLSDGHFTYLALNEMAVIQ
jgi:hypothetical protein